MTKNNEKNSAVTDENYPAHHLASGKKWVRNAIVVMLFDIVVMYGVFFLALLLRFDFSFREIPDRFLNGYLLLLPIWCVFLVVTFYVVRLYHSIWRFVSMEEAVLILKAYLIIAPLIVISSLILKMRMPISFYMVGTVGSAVGSAVGASVGSAAGTSVGSSVGSAAGTTVGASVGSCGA